MSEYIIPANAKKSTLILGFFTTIDLIIFLIGIIFTILMVILIRTSSLKVLILIILPALIVSFLVMPVPYYHNVLQLLVNIFVFFTQQQEFKWKGWCIENEED